MLIHFFSNQFRQNSSIVFIAVVLTLAIFLTLISSPAIADAQEQNTTKGGIFIYTQTDESENPEWLNTGHWSLTGIESSSPESENLEWIDTGNWSLTGGESSLPVFEAEIDMVKPNGSAAHEHEVNNLVVSEYTSSQTGLTTIQGNTTITMRDGPVTDEPTTITLDGNEISLYFDPAKIDNHFGNQSITGSVS